MTIPKRLLTDTIEVFAHTGRGFSGPIYSGVPAVAKARVELGYRKITDANGQDVVIDGTVFVHPSDSISIGDKVTYDTQNYSVVAVQPMSVGSSVHHCEAAIKSLGVA